MNYMKMVEFVGLTGPIKFDTSGLRTQFELVPYCTAVLYCTVLYCTVQDLMELQLGGLERVGSWNSLDHLAGSRQAEDTAGDANSDPMANKTFIITTILVCKQIVIFEDLYFELSSQNDPFAMLVESQKKLEGNARFEGFTIDLADELSKFLQFNYTIKLVDDGAYGSETSPGRAVNKVLIFLGPSLNAFTLLLEIQRDSLCLNACFV